MDTDKQVWVFFDGECAMCNALVHWVRKRDVDGVLAFDTLQCEEAVRVLKNPASYGDTMLLYMHGKVYARSEAALRVCGFLKKPWRWLVCLRVLPVGLRDGVYRFVAKHRHRIWGRDVCELK